MTDVPWPQALDLVLASRDLDQRRFGDLILVAPREELLQRDRDAQMQQLLRNQPPAALETIFAQAKAAIKPGPSGLNQ
ncbi:MAG: hypothetical protein EB116_16210 [Betaproteobacteria bacterium]|nr:hypothetical protein [Betaproteobacteria bacterium]